MTLSAVPAASGRDAAWMWSSAGGLGATIIAGTVAYSAYPPGAWPTNSAM